MARNPDQIDVLFIDDDPGRRTLTVRFLEDLDDRITVTTETDAASALEEFHPDTFDCILSEFDLAEIDGLRLLQSFRAEYPHFPFILYTGAGSEELASQAIAAGVTDYLPHVADRAGHNTILSRILAAIRAYEERKEDQFSTQLLETSPDAIIVSVDQSIIYCNQTAVELFESESKGDMRERAIEDFVHPDDHSKCFAKFEEIATDDATLQVCDAQLQTVNGEPLEAELAIRRISWNGEPGMVAIVRSTSVQQANTITQPHQSRQLRSILDTVEAAIFMKDREGRYLLMNQNCRELLGLSPEKSVVGLTDRDLFSEAIAAQIMADDTSAFEAGETIEIEEEVPTTNGTRLHLTRKTPLFDENGDAYAVCAVSTDITEQKEREQKLQERLKELSAIHQTVELCESDQSLNVLFAEFSTLLTESVRFPALSEARIEYGPVEHTTERFECVSHTMKATVPDTDGENLVVEIGYRDAPMERSEKAKIEDIFLQEERELLETLAKIVSNYLERRAHVDELERLSELLRNAEELGNVGVWETNMATGDVYWSEGTRRIHEVTDEFDPTIQNTLEFFPEQEQQTMEAIIRDCLKTGEPFRETVRMYTHQGKENWIRIYGEIIEDDGPIIRGYTQSITEEIQTKQRLAVMDRVLRHNLRNDMNVIISQAELIGEKLADEQSAGIKTILSRADALLELTEKQREVTKLLTSPQSPPATNLVEAINRSIERATANHPNATISFEHEDSDVETIPYIEDAIDELLDNGIKHSKTKEPKIAIKLENDGGKIHISVADNGPGIPKHEQQPITSERIEGALSHSSGMGLWTVKWIVNHAGGSLSFAENQPTGSIVRITLPNGGHTTEYLTD